jgi:hypothetical protein
MTNLRVVKASTTKKKVAEMRRVRVTNIVGRMTTTIGLVRVTNVVVREAKGVEKVARVASQTFRLLCKYEPGHFNGAKRARYAHILIISVAHTTDQLSNLPLLLLVSQ